MAYDKPLKTQWIEINGRTVPLVLPQYWDENVEDWVVSSTSNRLPVDAQLTGSLVSLGEVIEEVTLASDVWHNIVSNKPILDFKSIRVGVRWGEQVDHEIQIIFNTSSVVGGAVGLLENQRQEISNERQSEYERDVVGGRLGLVRVKQNSGSDKTLEVAEVLGVR